MPEWQVHNQSTNISRAGIAVSCVLHCYFMSTDCGVAGQSERSVQPHAGDRLEIMLYHDDEPLTFDLVWDMAVGVVRRSRMSAKYNLQLASSRQKRSATGFMRVFIRYAWPESGSPVRPDSVQRAARCEFLLDGVLRQPGNPTAVEGNLFKSSLIEETKKVLKLNSLWPSGCD